MKKLRWLHPAFDANQAGYLDVGDGHEIYYEESGNPEGIPVLFVHGGPGGQSSPKTRRFFDPEKVRVVQFDQRGAGKSRPHACLDNNTTWHLVEDMEKVRNHLDIDRWILFGGSWGSALALSYTIMHPERVRALVLRGIFLLRKPELEWFYQGGAATLFPEYWEEFLSVLPKKDRGNVIQGFYEKLTTSNEREMLRAARAWTLWEKRVSYLNPDRQLMEGDLSDSYCKAFARIECHYFVNKGFFEVDGWILKEVKSIINIPCTIIQGRYDVVCPFMTAWDLHQAYPKSDMKVVASAGHSAFEDGITKELVRAVDEMLHQ